MRPIDADALRENMKFVCMGVMAGTEPYAAPLTEIDNAPTIEPEQQWIPCSKTKDLPKHEVLCCDKYGEELIGWLSYSDDQWLCESDCEMMYDPIAWREKPEPWRGEDDAQQDCP